jgi:hypothetical protein
MNDRGTMCVLAAAYRNMPSVDADVEAVKKGYMATGTGHDVDVAVIQRDASGRSHVIRKHEQPARRAPRNRAGRGRG